MDPEHIIDETATIVGVMIVFPTLLAEDFPVSPGARDSGSSLSYHRRGGYARGYTGG